MAAVAAWKEMPGRGWWCLQNLQIISDAHREHVGICVFCGSKQLARGGCGNMNIDDGQIFRAIQRTHLQAEPIATLASCWISSPIGAIKERSWPPAQKRMRRLMFVGDRRSYCVLSFCFVAKRRLNTEEGQRWFNRKNRLHVVGKCGILSVGIWKKLQSISARNSTWKAVI